ncbi:MAG: recombination protein RecR [Clostridiales bacterium]|jgi:recombination protein RecR|nr:recombination protein RecR [Clostridiales bacterium]
MTPTLEKLVSKLNSLPGIGRKSAIRLAYHIVSLDDGEVKALVSAITDAKNSLKLCKVCQNYSEQEICPLCSSPNRDKSVICVVEDPKSVSAIEELHEFNGLFHVLHGVISPMDGVTPEQLKIKELLARIDSDEEIREVIVATNPSVEGEATGMYLSKLLRPLGVKVTRLAYGLPVGATLEYADAVTLAKALEGRTEV